MSNETTTSGRNDAIVYIVASILTVVIVLPLAVATQNTRQGMFDECFETPCKSETLLADLVD